ncbi:MAG TPA: hypothetical protein PKY82_12885 [Pyrinomonadaceae bacterium]|nr:hypothetical protein [Pyrinomonadaceae bacterium]
MKKLLLLLAIVFLLMTNIFATESDIKMQFNYKYDSPDILSILRFEGINFDKVTFVGEDLKEKHFIISIKEFTNGKFAKQIVALDSNELGDLGKIKSNTFSFRVLSKRTIDNLARFQFQFDRFSSEKEFKVGEKLNGFVMKNFLGAKTETAIPVNESTYIMTYMMPYDHKDGSKSYCEVAQSGINPEEFGTKYAIPTYFLIDIKFQ